jgi:hypothetical protein
VGPTAEEAAAILPIVADPTFSQPERRSLAAPLAIAAVLLIAAAAAILHYIPRRPAELAITHTAVWQAHTVFKSDTILVGRDTTQDDLYILATLRIDDHLHIPIFVKDLTATLTTADGQLLTTSAIEKLDLPTLYQTFPAIKPLSSAPLLRETTIAPGQSAEGMVILRFPITQDDWNHRQSAALAVDFYHQSSQTIPFEKPAAK